MTSSAASTNSNTPPRTPEVSPIAPINQRRDNRPPALSVLSSNLSTPESTPLSPTKTLSFVPVAQATHALAQSAFGERPWSDKPNPPTYFAQSDQPQRFYSPSDSLPPPPPSNFPATELQKPASQYNPAPPASSYMPPVSHGRFQPQHPFAHPPALSQGYPPPSYSCTQAPPRTYSAAPDPQEPHSSVAQELEKVNRLAQFLCNSAATLHAGTADLATRVFNLKSALAPAQYKPMHPYPTGYSSTASSRDIH